MVAEQRRGRRGMRGQSQGSSGNYSSLLAIGSRRRGDKGPTKGANVSGWAWGWSGVGSP